MNDKNQHPNGTYTPKKRRKRRKNRKKCKMSTIVISRDPQSKRVVNVVRNPNSKTYLLQAGKWDMDMEFLTEDEYKKLPICNVCGCWNELCQGLHILGQPADQMLP